MEADTAGAKENIMLSRSETESRLRVLEEAYRAKKAVKQSKFSDKIRLVPSSKPARDTSESGENQVNTASLNIIREDSGQVSPIANSFSIRKFTTMPNDKAPLQDFERSLLSKTNIGEKAQQAYKNALLQGATTKEALKLVGQYKESDKSPVQAEDVSEIHAEPPFRITKFTSFSKSDATSEDHVHNKRS